RRLRPGRQPGGGGRRGGGRLRGRLPGRRLRDPAVRLRGGDRRRDGQPEGRAGGWADGRPARPLRPGAVPRAVLLLPVRAEGRDPRDAADGAIRSGVRPALGLTLAAAGLVVAPPFLSPYLLTLTTQALIYAILAMSLDLLLGYTGLSSLGHAAYLGL